MKNLHLTTTLALALAAGAAHAQIGNTWAATGDAQAVAGHLTATTAYHDGSDDADGINRNVTGNDPLEAGFAPGGLEEAVGVPYGALDPVGSFAAEGSALTQSFTAAAGSRLSFSWDFSTMATSGDAGFADVAFVVLDGQVIQLASSLDAGTTTGAGSYAAHTGWADWSTTLSGGAHTISFGVVDVGDTADTSALDVTGVSLGVSAVPEGSTFAMMAAGLGLLGLVRRRRG